MKPFSHCEKRWLITYATGLLQNRRVRTLDDAMAYTFEEFPDWKTPEYEDALRAALVARQETATRLTEGATAEHVRLEKERKRATKRKPKRMHLSSAPDRVLNRMSTRPADEHAEVRITPAMRAEARLREVRNPVPD